VSGGELLPLDQILAEHEHGATDNSRYQQIGDIIGMTREAARISLRTSLKILLKELRNAGIDASILQGFSMPDAGSILRAEIAA
jgi:hypothetical protein